MRLRNSKETSQEIVKRTVPTNQKLENSLDGLPPELLDIILHMLDKKSLGRMFRVSKRFQTFGTKDKELKRKIKVWRWSQSKAYTVDDIRTATRMDQAGQLQDGFLQEKAKSIERALESYAPCSRLPILTTEHPWQSLGSLQV